MKNNFYKIGFYESNINGSPYPFEVSINLGNDETPIAVSEGSGFGGVGCSLTVKAILSSNWDDHFKKCTCFEIVKVVQEIIDSGQKVTSEKIKYKWIFDK